MQLLCSATEPPNRHLLPSDYLPPLPTSVDASPPLKSSYPLPRQLYVVYASPLFLSSFFRCRSLLTATYFVIPLELSSHRLRPFRNVVRASRLSHIYLPPFLTIDNIILTPPISSCRCPYHPTAFQLFLPLLTASQLIYFCIDRVKI